MCGLNPGCPSRLTQLPTVIGSSAVIFAGTYGFRIKERRKRKYKWTTHSCYEIRRFSEFRDQSPPQSFSVTQFSLPRLVSMFQGSICFPTKTMPRTSLSYLAHKSPRPRDRQSQAHPSKCLFSASMNLFRLTVEKSFPLRYSCTHHQTWSLYF